MSDKIKVSNNNLIDIYRILFTTVIMLHHFRLYSDALPFGGGYMATDFFFILSGYLMYRSIGNEDDSGILRGTCQYAVKRYKRLVIPLIACNFIMLAVTMLTTPFRFPMGIGGFVRENLMIEIFSIGTAGRFNAPTWYLGILLLASIVVFAVLKTAKRLGIKDVILNIVFVAVIAGYFVLIYISRNGNIYIQNNTIFDGAAFGRGISGVCAGVLIGKINIVIDRKITYPLAAVLTLFYVFLLIWKDGYSLFDMVVYVAIAVGIILCAVTDWTETGAVPSAFKLIAQSSYAGYLIHYPISRIMKYYDIWRDMDWKMYSLLYIVIVWIAAIMLELLFKYIGELLRYREKKNV